MMTKNITSYMEVREVLKIINEEDRNKIPSSLLTSINEVSSDTAYTLKYNKYGNLIFSKDAEAMLLYLYKEYITANNEEIQMAINERLKINQQIKNNIKNIFNKTNAPNELFSQKEDSYQYVQEKEITELIVKKDSLFKKIINKIKDFINLNRRKK